MMLPTIYEPFGPSDVEVVSYDIIREDLEQRQIQVADIFSSTT